MKAIRIKIKCACLLNCINQNKVTKVGLPDFPGAIQINNEKRFKIAPVFLWLSVSVINKKTSLILSISGRGFAFILVATYQRS